VSGILFLGYHAMGCAGLSALLEEKAPVAGLVTHQDDPAEELWFDRPAGLARRHGVPVFTPPDSKGPEFRRLVESLEPDWLFSVYFRWMVPERVLRLARLGAYNLHGSLLPRYRGRCPVNWVILNGETETGLTLHHMVRRADAGDVVGQRRVPIAPRETARTLYEKMIPAARDLVRECWPPIRDGKAPRIPQDESLATVFGGRRPEDGLLRWDAPAVVLDRLVRAVAHPYPGAFTAWGGRKLFVWVARPAEGKGTPGEVLGRAGGALLVACGEGALLVESAQLEGEAERPGGELAIPAGARLGTGNG